MSLKYSHNDHYVDPETGVLKNKLGIRDEAELEKAEADIISARLFAMDRQPLAGEPDFAFLKALHKFMFGDIYDWAGKLRTVDLAKGGSFFASHPYIESEAQKLFAALAAEKYLAGLDKATFSQRAAYYLSEINALHPFREGNGRVQREFINQIAKRNGFEIDWSPVTPEQMLEASIKSFHGDNSLLSGLIHRNIHDKDRENDLERGR